MAQPVDRQTVVEQGPQSLVRSDHPHQLPKRLLQQRGRRLRHDPLQMHADHPREPDEQQPAVDGIELRQITLSQHHRWRGLTLETPNRVDQQISLSPQTRKSSRELGTLKNPITRLFWRFLVSRDADTSLQ